MSAKAKVEYHDATIAHFLSHQREVALDLARQELSDSEKQYLVIDKSLGSKGTRGILDSVLQSVEEIAKKDSGSSSGLGRFVSRFKHYIGIVDRAVQHHAEITSLVWASIVLVLQVYDNDMRIKAALQECFETVLTSMVLGELYIETYLKAVAAESSGVPEIGIGQVDSDWKQRTDNALAELYAAILVLCVKARAYLDSKGLSRVTKAFVPFEEWLAPCITKIATKEKFLKDLADTGAHRQIAGTGQKVDELLNYIKDLHMELAKLSSSVSKGLEDRTASSNPVHNPLRSIGSDITDQTVFDWLNSVNPESMYQMHLDQHLVGTCDWLKSDPVYKAWVDGKQNIWLEGIPGSGKSVLAASVVQDLRQAIDKLDDVILLYHFFWVDDKPTTSPLAMVSSLISQLLLKSKPDMKASLMEILKQAILEASHFKGGQLSEEAELLQRYKSLLNILAEYARVGRILILLDGLDECSHPTLLAKRLFGQPADSLNSEYYSHVRLLLTGRPVVADLFSNIPGFKLIDMESRDDIKTMVTFKVKENPALQQIESKILGKILETSDGMFRYAALLFEELLVEVYPPIPLEDRLKSMPSGIAGMYENILERLDDATLELRRRILASVAAAERPLTVKEIQGICMTDLESGEYNHKIYLPPTRSRIVAACGSLISIRAQNPARAAIHSFGLLDVPVDTEPSSVQELEYNSPDGRKKVADNEGDRDHIHDYFDEEEDFVVVYSYYETIRFSHRTVGEFLHMDIHNHSERARTSAKISSCLLNHIWCHWFLASVCAIHLLSPDISNALASNKLFARSHQMVDSYGDPLNIDPALITILWDTHLHNYALLHWFFHFQYARVVQCYTYEGPARTGISVEDIGGMVFKRGRNTIPLIIDYDYVLTCFAKLFWDKRYLRRRVAFLTLISYMQLYSRGEHSVIKLDVTRLVNTYEWELLSPYKEVFFEAVKHFFYVNPKSLRDSESDSDKLAPYHKRPELCPPIEVIYEQDREFMAMMQDLDSVTFFGCCWSQSEQVGLNFAMSYHWHSAEAFLSKLFEYEVDLNKDVRPLSYHLYPSIYSSNDWTYDLNVKLPSLLIMYYYVEAIGHSSSSHVFHRLGILTRCNSLDINRKGQYFTISRRSRTTTGTLLHMLCDLIRAHISEEGPAGRPDATVRKIPRWRHSRCDEANILKDMLALVLDNRPDLQINSLDSHGYSALGLLLEKSPSRRGFDVGHDLYWGNQTKFWCYGSAGPDTIVKMLEEKGAKAIYPRRKGFFTRIDQSLQIRQGKSTESRVETVSDASGRSTPNPRPLLSPIKTVWARVANQWRKDRRSDRENKEEGSGTVGTAAGKHYVL